MKNKSFIIGMAGLVLGSALLGGVAGHFLTKRPNDTKPANPDIVSEDKYNDFELPDELNYASFTKFDLGDDIDVFASNSGTSYFLNKKTKEFKFLCSGKLLKFVEIDDNKYVCYNSDNLYVFDTKTFEFNLISLGGRYRSFSVVSCLSNNSLFIQGTNESNEYHVFKFDVNTLKYEKYKINSSISYSDYVFEYSNKFLFMRGSDSSSSYNAYSLSKETGEIKTINSVYFNISSFRKPTAIQKENKLYMVARISNTTKLGIYDFDTEELTSKDLTSFNYADDVRTTDKGIYLISNSSSYNSFFIDFGDDSVNIIGKYNTVFSIDNKLYFSCVENVEGSSSSSYKKAVLYTFDEETKTTTSVFDSGALSYPEAFKFVEFGNNKYIYVKVGSGNYSYITYKYENVEGSVNFTLVSMNDYMNEKYSYKISDDEYLFYYGGLSYYNLKTDTYKKLITSNTFSVKDITRDKNVVTIRTVDYIYEFNLKTLSCACVGYYENV